MDVETNSNVWSHTTLLWMVVVIWFCSNVLSQAIFMGMNGYPYGSDLLLNELGKWYWILLVAEIFVYVVIGGYFFKKISKLIKPV